MPLTREEYMAVGGYTDVNPAYQYLSLHGRGLEVKGLKPVLTDLTDDNIIKHLDLGFNVSVKGASNPDNMEAFLRSLRLALKNNQYLTALDLAGNNLFLHTAHPCNEHLFDYLTHLTDTLMPSAVTRVDLSENFIVGKNGRMYTGLRYFMVNFMLPQGEALRARKSHLHSYCYTLIAEGIGAGSSLTELDLSDNLAGIDPMGKPSSDGISALCTQLMNTLQLRVLKLARNHILDDDVVSIANAVSYMPSCQVLDLSGNFCAYFGARALKFTIMSHGTLSDPKTGLLELALSQNALQAEGTLEICEAIKASYTLTHVSLAGCEIDRPSMFALKDALALNSTIISLDVSNNRVTPFVQANAESEVEAMRNILLLRKDPMKIDATKLSKAIYSATAKKLRFLSTEVLRRLHHNESFNIIPSEMRDNLHVLEPPGRVRMIGSIKTTSTDINERLAQSRAVEVRMRASRKIFNVVIVWMREWQKERQFERAMEALRNKSKKNDQANEDQG